MRALGDLLWGLVIPLALLIVMTIFVVVLAQGWGIPVVLG